MGCGSIFSSLQRYWKYRSLFLAYGWQLLAGILALLVTNLCGIAIPWKIREAIDLLQHQAASKPHGFDGLSALQPILWTLFGLCVGLMIVRVASRLLLLGAGRKTEYDLRDRLYRHLLKMPMRYYMNNPTGELMSRLTNDVGSIRYLTGGGIMIGFNTLIAYATTLPMMVLLSPRLTLIAFCLYPVAVFFLAKLAKRSKTGTYAVQEQLASISAVAQENLSGMSVIQSYVKEEGENQRFQQVCQGYFDRYQGLIQTRVLQFILMSLLSGLSLWIVLLEGGHEVIGKQLNLGGFIAFSLYLERLAWPTTGIGWILSIFQQGWVALERVDEVLSEQEPPQAVDGGAVLPTEGKQDLRINRLTFHYPNHHQPVLKDISLTLPAGKLIAIVGPVGAGKTTLLSLFPRLYEVADGHLFWGEQDLNRVNLHALRQAIAFMPQQSFLFSSSLFDNIAFGEPDSTFDRVQEVSKLSAFHHEVDRFPEGYQTVVGERGITLSGGQRQRVTLSRALLLAPRLLILDDPFSNVDADTETRIVDALLDRQVFAEKMTLIATHRFSLVARADLVVLMAAGQVIATGTHAELLASQPLYQELNRLESRSLKKQEQAKTLEVDLAA